MKVHHFGYLTTSIEKSVKEFSLLGYVTFDKLYFDDVRGINIQFIRSISGELIELIESVSEMSIVKGLLSTNKNKIYHICYYTTDIEQKIDHLKKQGFVLISPPQPAIALNNSNVAFLLSKYAGMIELYEDYHTE
jgi:methylmalonyl-CoA/ethylmalonyl-CoA epimerase